MAVRALLLVVAVAFLAGCGGSDDDSARDDRGDDAGDDRRGRRRPPASRAPPRPVSRWKSDLGETALLTGVRAASHDGYDRVVFEFRNGVPGYDVGYVERPVRADGSGEPVEVDGGAVLLVRMEPALDADLTQESAPRTYTGPARLRARRDRLSSSSSARAASSRSSRGPSGSTRSGRSGSRASRAPPGS